MPDRPRQHLHWKFGYTWCNRLWHAAYDDLNLPMCQACVNRKEEADQRRSKEKDQQEKEV